MKVVGLLVAAAIACAPAAGVCAFVQYAAPAGDEPAGHLRGSVYDAVLPSGRLVTPFGTSVVTGVNALGLALSPDGRYAIVSNDDQGAAGPASAVDPRLTGGYSLAVIDTATLRVVDRVAVPGETYFAGLAAVRDPRDATRTVVFAAGGPSNVVYVFDLDAAGHATPDAVHVIPIAGPDDPAFGGLGQSFPATLVAGRDGGRIYVIDEGGDSVTAIDTALRAVSGAGTPVGFSPFGAALAGDRLLVANEGALRYRMASDPLIAPAFAQPPADLFHASSLSFVGLGPGGDLPVDVVDPSAGTAELPMDPSPDGLRVVGGAQPSAVAVTPDAGYAFVAMSNVDRIASVALGPAPQVVGGTELRLFDRGPYGTQPAALALSQDGTRLYVALAGLNAVAVLDSRDPRHLHRLGLIPTGWFPSALSLSADDRTLFVLNTKGFGHDIGVAGFRTTSAVWSTLQKIDLGAVSLSQTTTTALKNTRDVRAAAPSYPRALRDVIVIVQERKTFDAMLGDLGYGPADPRYVAFGAAVTPNLHALARRYAVAGNMFADAEESAGAHEFLASGIATLSCARSLFANGGRPLLGSTEDPDDYPRAGSIFNDLARHHISFRDYGDLVRVVGYDDEPDADPRATDPAFAGIDDRLAPTKGLGGRYTADVPAPAVLAGHIDLDYPGWNLRIRDERRAREFIRDYAKLVGAHRQPRYTHIWLPADHTGSGPDIPPAAEEVADGDRALGMIVAYLSRLKSWKNTAIFVLPDDTPDAGDHVDGSRTYALVISPFAKEHFVGMRHLSTVSVLKTSEQILKVPPLTLGDLLATDMSDFFSPESNLRPFAALPVPVQTAGTGPGSN